MIHCCVSQRPGKRKRASTTGPKEEALLHCRGMKVQPSGPQNLSHAAVPKTGAGHHIWMGLLSLAHEQERG